MRRRLDHLLLISASVLMGGPLLMIVIFSGLAGGLSSRPGSLPDWDGFLANWNRLNELTGNPSAPAVQDMVVSSLLVAGGVAVLTTAVAFLASYAMVFLERRGTRIWFWVTLLTLYFPIEARMLPTFEITAGLGLTDTLTGLVLPILPLALATLVLRQHMKAFPPEYLEAARLDAAGPLRFLWDFVLPLSLVPIAAVLVITFVIGWNQYLWPLIVSVENTHFTLMRGLNFLGSGSGPSMVLALISILPPLLLVLAFLRLLPRVTAMRV
ncbi:MAG: carbohydrate ABC transporter permease [Silicimonas sp.]|nr:carbohydrate ABC transporter permease [Silicimonas sp.]